MESESPDFVNGLLREYLVEDLAEKIKAITNHFKLTEVCVDAAKQKRIDTQLYCLKNISVHNNRSNLQTMRLINKIVEENTLDVFPIDVESIERLDYKKKQYCIFGVGKWNRLDDELLPHFVHAHCQSNGSAVRASFSLWPTPCKQKNIDVDLVNLQPEGSEQATTRCIRAYNFVGGRFEQLHRIDWEPAPTLDHGKPEDTDYKRLDRVLERNARPLHAVIIEDHKKSVIDEGLVRKIKDKANQNTKWFVRTKNTRIRQADEREWPAWIREVESIELIAVGPEVSCRSYPINGLLTRKGRLAEHAYELIDTLINRKSGTERANRRVKNVVLTSDKLEVVALFGDFCFVAWPASGVENVELESLGWTTALYAALAHQMLTTKNGWHSDEDACKRLVERAIDQAYAHSGVKVPEVLRLSTDESCSNLFVDRATGSRIPKSSIKTVCDWPAMQRSWGQAKKGMGIIEFTNPRPGKRLEIWRASTDLPGYIACIDEKRAAVRRIWQKIHRFTLRKDIRNSLSILLEADPAVGKSYLARTLAKSVDCTFILHDISQMIHREELLDLFDMIAAAQAERSAPVFVFVDEINAKLDSSSVYGAFLSPLEAGNYMRRGRRFELKPSIWMFAGTRDDDGHEEVPEKKEKREDFESRLTMIERIDYRTMLEMAEEGERLPVQARLEQVYLGAKMINDAFNDVHWIDVDVLSVFHALSSEKAPARRIKRLATSLENVQYGRVHKGNCTSLEWQMIIDGIPSDEQKKWRQEFVDTNVEYVELDLI